MYISQRIDRNTGLENISAARIGIALLVLIAGADLQVIQVQQGALRGTTLQSQRSNKTYSAFYGIPYAKAPVGALRFKSPQPAESWNGTREAVVEGNLCPQKDPYTFVFEGEEDCLFLNVYTSQVPTQTQNESKAVLVWIHGGGWHFGNGGRSYNGPDYIIEEDVVLVVINYRLGALGFLSLPEAGIHGNNGFKDQAMALKWVQQNIAQFGGNPGRVTIFGASAGGASVHYHMLSPMSRGLFHRAILQSGTGINYWAFNNHEINRNYTFLLGEVLGLNISDSSELSRLLRAETPEKIVNATFELKEMGHGIPFHPIVDTTSDPGDVFLPDIPRTLVRNGRFNRVPFIAGINSREGIWEIKNINDALAKNSVILEDIPDELDITLEENRKSDVAEEIRRLYFGNSTVSNASIDQHIDLSGDLLIVTAVYLTAKKQAQFMELPVYFYEFSYSGGMSVFKKLVQGENFTGSCHMDDTAYLFRLERMHPTFEDDSSETRTSRRIVRLWTNFAKTGNPTPGQDPLLQNVLWTPISQTDIAYLSIGEDISLQHHFKKSHMDFWEKLYQFNTTLS